MPSPTFTPRVRLLRFALLTISVASLSFAACGDDSSPGPGDGAVVAPSDGAVAPDAPGGDAGGKPGALPGSDGGSGPIVAPRTDLDGGPAVTPPGDAAPSPDLRPAFAVPSGPPPDVTKLCATLCERLSTCDTTRDAQTCAQSCVNTNAALVAKLRGDVLLAALGWAQAADCRAVLDPAFLRSALRMAAGTIAPSAAVNAFCDGYFKRADECLGSTNKMDCLDRAKVYSDETTAAAAACLPKGCGVVSACVQATLTGTTGAESLGGGVAPVTRCMGTRRDCSYHTYNLEECNQAPGCSGMTVCAGTPACHYHSTETACKAEAGCTWSPSATSSFDRCSGTPTTTCAARGPTACRTNLGCSTSVRCMGTPTACEMIPISKCASAPGCGISDGTTRVPF